MTTRGITVLAGGLRQTQEITRRAELAGFDAAWSGEFLRPFAESGARHITLIPAGESVEAEIDAVAEVREHLRALA